MWQESGEVQPSRWDEGFFFFATRQ